MSSVVRDRRPFRSPVVRIGLCAAALTGLTACSSDGPAASVAPGQDSVSTKLGNLLAFNSNNAPGGAPASAAGPRIDCPIVQIEPGSSAFRAGGESSASVRYQISIGDVARECARQGDNLAIRVGVETTTVLGPAGSPGTFSAPLRVTVRRQFDEHVLASKTYRVGATVGASAPVVTTLVADPLLIPFTNEHAADDYEVVLSFGEGPAAPRRKRN